MMAITIHPANADRREGVEEGDNNKKTKTNQTRFEVLKARIGFSRGGKNLVVRTIGILPSFQSNEIA